MLIMIWIWIQEQTDGIGMKWSKDWWRLYIYIYWENQASVDTPFGISHAPSSVGCLGRAYSRNEDE